MEADLARGTNTHANAAVVCGLLSLLGWPIAAAAGLVFGVLGLRRAGQYAAGGHAPLGRVPSVCALILALAGTAVSAALFLDA